MKRKPMTFDIDRTARVSSEMAGRMNPGLERKQVGARIPAATYRQLKSRAALDGVPVQVLVEKAIAQFLAATAKA